MEYAVILLFDGETEARVSAWIEGAAASSGNAYMIDHAIPPHITLSMFSRDGSAGLDAIAREFAAGVERFEMRFVSIGAFSPSVLFLAPVVTAHLLRLSFSLNQRISDDISAVKHYYLPDRWVPHISVGLRLSPEQLLGAFGHLKGAFQPFAGKVTRLAVVECDPFRDVVVVDL